MAGTEKATWAGCLKLSSVASLDSLRLSRNLEGCLAGDYLWVRGHFSESLKKVIQSVPWQRSYEVLPGGKLRVHESRLPDGRLPSGPWSSLSILLMPEMPVALLPGQRHERVELAWQPATREKPPTLLLATAEHWLAFVSEASQVRLEALRFVQNDHHQILIRGTPLPSIPGNYFSVEDDIATPAGRELRPCLSPQTLRGVLGLGNNEMALLLEDGTFSGIPDHAWMVATRSTVRLNVDRKTYGSA